MYWNIAGPVPFCIYNMRKSKKQDIVEVVQQLLRYKIHQ